MKNDYFQMFLDIDNFSFTLDSFAFSTLSTPRYNFDGLLFSIMTVSAAFSAAFAFLDTSYFTAYMD